MKILEIYNSKADKYGNCYWAFRLITEDGRKLEATTTGGAGNIRSALYDLAGDWEKARVMFQVVEIELPIRKFDAMVKGWPNAGCRPDAIAEFIEEGLK